MKYKGSIEIEKSDLMFVDNKTGKLEIKHNNKFMQFIGYNANVFGVANFIVLN